MYAEWHRRLAGVLGGVAARIEHVGSTAVPGLDAKPVIDVQVSVADVEDEHAYVPALESLGLFLRAREPGHRFLRHRPDLGEARIVHVHVCAEGSEWERDHLLFRDYLLAHPERSAIYATIKRELAARHPNDRLAYTDGKDEFVRSTLALAEEWASARGWTP
jgi:GrpB-like predicted nucleotidyltransferase (UPF0157 family)